MKMETSSFCVNPATISDSLTRKMEWETIPKGKYSTGRSTEDLNISVSQEVENVCHECIECSHTVGESYGSKLEDQNDSYLKTELAEEQELETEMELAGLEHDAEEKILESHGQSTIAIGSTFVTFGLVSSETSEDLNFTPIPQESQESQKSQESQEAKEFEEAQASLKGNK